MQFWVEEDPATYEENLPETVWVSILWQKETLHSHLSFLQRRGFVMLHASHLWREKSEALMRALSNSVYSAFVR